MSERINKPRVFLSHSKKDIEFIESLYNDLKKCQIEPWLDSEEIRHGQPWLSAIFEDGLPTCDCVLVYLTEHSIKSGMVQKEIDVGVLNKLKDSSISFLPYVNNSELRSSLRSDLQTLQAPEWNIENYKDLLPKVISEIWRSYMERKIPGVISSERVKRLEAELELERSKVLMGDSPFRSAELLDFEYIYERLNRNVTYTVEKYKNNEKIGEKLCKTNILSMLPKFLEEGNRIYSKYSAEHIITEFETPYESKNETGISSRAKNIPDLKEEFLMYGFLNSVFIPPSQVEERSSIRGRSSTTYVFQEKVDRFRYWLGFMNKSVVKFSVEECEIA